MIGQQFYYCTVCGTNLIGAIKHSGVPMCCCYREMELIRSNQMGFPAEHDIQVAIGANSVHVQISGRAGGLHPMSDDHRIEWIYLHTQKLGQRKMLWPGKEPQAVFQMEQEEPAILYAYCSEHGLWEKALPLHTKPKELPISTPAIGGGHEAHRTLPGTVRTKPVQQHEGVLVYAR